MINLRFKFRRTALSFSTLIALASGCGYSQREMPQIETNKYVYKVEEGVRIYAEPFDTEKECRKVFQHDLNKKAYLPIFLRIENTTTQDIKLDRDNVEFFSSNNTPWMQVHGSRVARSYESAGSAKSTLLGFLFGALSGMLSALQEQQNNYERIADFETKGLNSLELIITEGREEGFVYFKDKKERSMSKDEFASEIVNGKLLLKILIEQNKTRAYTFDFKAPSNWEER